MVAIKCLQIVAFALGLIYSGAFSSPRPTISNCRPGQTRAKLLSNNAPYSAHPSDHQVCFRQLRHASVHSPSARRASSSAISATSSSGDGKSTIVATFLLILIDVRLRSLFMKYSIAFPSSLAGCGALFASMIALDVFSGSEKIGEKVYERLNPGATLLAKWLPVFFVPSLITLPLASGLGNAVEVSRYSLKRIYFIHLCQF